jgi:hypothetical protein
LCNEAARAADVPYEAVHVFHDHPYQAIIDEATSRGCDLIVMASHGRRGISALVLGSENQQGPHPQRHPHAGLPLTSSRGPERLLREAPARGGRGSAPQANMVRDRYPADPWRVTNSGRRRQQSWYRSKAHYG